MVENLIFRQIETEKSNQLENDLRKFTITCGDYPYAHCFIWVDKDGMFQHIQLTFDEHFIEVKPGNQCSFGNLEKSGGHGIRTLKISNDREILKKALDILNISVFPDLFKQAHKLLISSAQNILDSNDSL